MARKRMVTRTINATTVEVIGMNTETCEVKSFYHIITGDTPDEKKALKLCKKWFDRDNFTVCKAGIISVSQKLYGIPEEVFIQYAEELPPRTKIDKETGLAIVE